MRIRFSIMTMLLCVAVFAAGVVYWKSQQTQQPTGIRGIGNRPTLSSVHYRIQSFSDLQHIELVLQKDGLDDPQLLPIPVTLSAGEGIELLFQNDKFYWFDSRIHPALSPQIMKDISTEIQASRSWLATPENVQINEKNPKQREVIHVYIANSRTNYPYNKYAIVVRKQTRD